MNAAPEIAEGQGVGMPELRTEIERLMASRGVESLEELHARFIEGGYGRVDRYDRNISLKRFEVYVNGESGVVSDRFYRGLRETLGLTREEEERLVLIHIGEVIGRPLHLEHEA
jgi:hypothetical protein